MRITGGSMSVRMSYPTMRRLGALARAMLLQAGAEQLRVPLGRIDHPTRLAWYTLRPVAPWATASWPAAPWTCRYRTRPASPCATRASSAGSASRSSRVDAYDKSTGKALYTIDLKVDGMLHAAVQHAPRLGMTSGQPAQPGAGRRPCKACTRCISCLALWRWSPSDSVACQRAVEAIQVDWLEAGRRRQRAGDARRLFQRWLPRSPRPARPRPVTMKTKAMSPAHWPTPRPSVEATYHNQYVNHAQLEPPSALARFNPDGSLDIWLPNQAPDMFRADIAKRTGLAPAQINLHSPLLGGFFWPAFPL